MLEVLINKKSIKGPKENTTLKSFLDKILDSNNPEQSFLNNLVLDGNEIKIENRDQYLAMLCSDFQSIQINTISREQLCFEALASSIHHLDITNQSLILLAEQIRKGRDNEIHQTFFDAIDQIDLFVQLLTQVKQFLAQKNKESTDLIELFEQHETDLLKTLTDVLKSKQKNDNTLLSDLLEYEVTDNLMKWKTNLIPQIQEFLQEKNQK